MYASKLPKSDNVEVQSEDDKLRALYWWSQMNLKLLDAKHDLLDPRKIAVPAKNDPVFTDPDFEKKFREFKARRHLMQRRMRGQ